MDNVLEHLTEGQDLVAATEAALSVSYPTVKTLNSNARWANEWRRPVAAGDIADSQELRDIVGLLVFLCSMMTDKCLLYELKAYDYSHEELWNALSDVRGHFDPGRTSYWSDHVFADLPDGGFRDTPEYQGMNHNRLTVLQQKEMALEQLIAFLKERGHAKAVAQFRSHLASEVETGHFP